MIIRRTQPQDQKPAQLDRDIYKLPGDINRFGVKILFDGSQWVIDAKTGLPAKRDGYEPFEGQRGYYLWVKKGETLRALDIPFPSVWDDSLRKKESGQ